MSEIEAEATWVRPKNLNPVNWPEGDIMTVQCPHCGADTQVQIATVKEFGDEERPAECDVCRRDFELDHCGSVRKLKWVKGKFGLEMAYAD